MPPPPSFRTYLIKRYWLVGAAVLLLTIHAGLALTSIRQKSCSFDEVAHLTKGYAFWHLEDNRLMPDHPPLGQAWAALALLDDELQFPRLDQPAWYGSKIYPLGKQFFYRMGNAPDTMLRQSRAMVVLLSITLGGIVCWWSTKLFGKGGGCVSLILYAFSPTVLANARLVTTDMVVALFFMLSVTAVWRVLHRVSIGSLLASSAALGGLFLAKMSAVLIFPMVAVLALVRLVDGRPLIIKLRTEYRVTARLTMFAVIACAALICLLGVWVVLWAGFDFRYEAMIDAEASRDQFFSPSPVPAGKTVWEHQSRGIPRVGAAIGWLREHYLLPEAYLYGFLSTMQGARGRDAFLNGERRLTGWWYFFPLCILYKVPLPIMGIIVLAVAGRLVRTRWRVNRQEGSKLSRTDDLLREIYHTAPLWILVVTYWAFAIYSNLNIGHRHLLPTFAPMFVLCGATAVWMRSSRKWIRVLVPGLLLILVIESVMIWPHYLAYFNPIAGGPSNGYRHLVDSSLDWGQDLPGLRQWLTDHETNENVYVAYFGTGNLRHYGIQATSIPRRLHPSGTGDYRLGGGTYCISATRLQQIYLVVESCWTPKLETEYRGLLPEMRAFEESPDQPDLRKSLLQTKGNPFKSRFKRFQRLRFARLCAYLRERKPDDHVGYSILIYRLTATEVRKALYG